MYTAEWKGDSHGYSLKDDRVPIYLDKCRALGIDIVHVHKGPTIHPLSSDAFDVRDIDDVATNFPDLKFVIDHCGIPRIDDFCWIANQEPNVYGGLSVVQGFVHMRPRYFASMMADLLFFVGADRLLFGLDYGIHSPKWLVEDFAAFQFDDETAARGRDRADPRRQGQDPRPHRGAALRHRRARRVLPAGARRGGLREAAEKQ